MDDQKRYINYTLIDAVGTPTHGRIWANMPRAEDEVRRRVQAQEPSDERIIALYMYDTGTKCLYGWNVRQDGTLEVMVESAAILRERDTARLRATQLEAERDRLLEAKSNGWTS